ncbi:FG-GAP-like repeat-containing protein [Flavobacterium pectinovorum]|uniref:RHS repeat-associated core domain-containing protein n=1 Tax=Flavobacterium pectinovorum TaxID=29533 RepID=A0AB36P514_9FLAO|nr:FG-GAP-like repeat-containing protein [Flavobacterium pectinovorum]OXB06441.1 hypothetical protein B0A72_05180 [Flavobacterium pectinovorum]SHL89348.1 RHS repeat-associated core domain-containing protein [Flavobacterium pectinovorum]
MKKLYFTLLFLVFGFLVSAQTSTEVGVTEGQLSVSLSGAANYTIPIAVPPGINGVVPQISLVYNSQGGNGLAGYGWNISGVSTISRIPSTNFHDGVIDPVDFNVLDRFALDGQRLIVKNGTSGVYGANGTQYETESFSNIKITSYGVNPDGAKFGPSYFIVEYPDGSKAYYGNSADSRSITDWAITYWENPQSVRISYAYSLVNNSLDIASIKYGSKSAGTPINEIKFEYSNRKRVQQIYVGGLSITKRKILNKIKVIGNSIGFRNYVLGYDETTLDYQRLTTITEKNGDESKSYNPTIFEYEKSGVTTIATPNITTIGMSNINSDTAATISGDFDGDGKMDFILYPTKGDQVKQKFWLFTDIKNTSRNIPKETLTGAFEELFPSTFLINNKISDSQGITAVQKATDSKAINFNTYYNSSYGAAVLNKKQIVFPVRNVANCAYGRPSLEDQSQEKKYYSGDFNGDGLTDVIAIDKEVPERDSSCKIIRYLSPGKVYFVDLDSRKTSNFWSEAGTMLDYVLIRDQFSDNDQIETFDVNGDGKTDILHFKSGSVTVYTLDSNNKLTLLWKMTDPNIVTNLSILPGDYNGDGKMDFIIPKSAGLTAYDYFKFTSTGVGFEKTTQSYSFPNAGTGTIVESGGGVSVNALIPLDFNGDGKTDIVHFRSIYGNTSKLGAIIIRSFNNTDTTFSFFSESTIDPTLNIKSYAIPVFLSPNQNNQYAEVGAITDNLIYTFDSQKDTSKETLINTITTGNGVKEIITYNPLKQDQYEPFYTPTSFTEIYPNIDITVAPNFKIVTKVEKQSSSDYSKQLFFYSGAVSNADGIGFLGFRSMVRTNWHDLDSNMISSVTRNDMTLRGANIENYSVLGLGTALRPNSIQTESNIIKEKSYTVTGSDNLVATQSITLKPDTWIKPGSTFSAKINEEANNSPNTPVDFITKSRLTYESELLPNKVFKLKNTITKQLNTLDNTGTETYTDFDANNNPLKSVTYLKEAGATVQTTVSNVSYDAATLTPYVLGRPSGKTQSVAIAGDVMTSEELYFYENSLLTKIKKKGTNTDYITEDNVYDAFGNILKKTITASGLSPRITSYEYDPSGRFLTKSTDIEGLSTSFVYNYSNGTLESETNPYGLKTSYLYDSWFKKEFTIDYLGKKNAYVYTKKGFRSIVTSTADDGSVTEETFDDLGRKLKTGTKNINGIFSYVEYLYDIHSRIGKVSEPYFGTQATQWNETNFDVYGRVIKNISFTGKVTDISYSGLTTIVNDGTKSKTSTKNAIGNIISMTDTPGGTIRYSYFANGNLKESDYNGVKTTISQDGWGRKTKLVDSSAGTYTYVYNGFGETTSTTTPNGTTNYVLDAVGKVTQKTISGTNTNSKTTYSYDPSSKLITSSKFEDLASGANTIFNSFTYDASKRISKTVETTPYAVFTKDFTYDGFGRADTETSTAATGGKSSSKVIKNTYSNGSHWQIVDNNTNEILWQTNTVNARGQLTSAQNGPTTITNLYDTYGLASQFKYDKTSGSINILTLSTVFDAQKGNLTSRTNSLFNRDENFKYDAQDRLTEFTNVQGIQEKQLYDDQGRITENILGKYTYSNEKPYQNASITVTPEALSYYTTKPTQIITYNAFKSPVLIDETGIDKISFEYNDNNSRTAMFYGGLQDDKLERPLRKYYSADGSMEIKENKTTGVYEFVTYIGGDGYSAPIVLKSNGITQEYLYLQRDYQGSIIAITNQIGTVVEKRLFDAWGAIVSVQDGAGNVLAGLTVLDRGYTGHEHLQSVGLINMNGRIYDPKLHRFLQPDNNIQDFYNTQNFNRYGYVLNNPLRYTDPSGEFWHIVIGAVIGGVVNWGTHGFRMDMEGLKAFGIGAGAGALGAATGGAAFGLAGGAAAGTGGFAAGAFSGGVGAMYSSMFLSLGNNAAFGDPLMSGKDFVKGIAIGAVTGGILNGVTALANGKTFLTGSKPIAVQPVTLPEVAGLAETKSGAQIKTDAKLPSTVETSAKPTTQTNTTGKATLTKNVDGSYKIEGLEYHPRVEEATDLYHNFPQSFDEHIIQNGAWAQRIKDGANWFELKGTINGVNGTYQIGINESNVIFHKSFIPLK